MVAIVKEITIKATTKRIFSALTQQDEIVRWWADEAQVRPEVGSLGNFSFRRAAFALQFEVTELDQDKQVRWISRQGPPQWMGTSVTWQLTPMQDETLLVFKHDGFTQIDRAYEETRMNWEYFLGSLKSYMETGKGTPGLPTF